jgi:4-amino-4-deoxy-L-arabinose transferase-like glycosyltransferase
MSPGRQHTLLAIILLIYLILGVLFAVYTPPWQAPDEPAHYNYIRYVAENRQFPVLQMGDYPHAYLEEIKSRKFAPDLSIDPIRYEYHQPPLYYSLAAPIYLLARGNLLPLRLFSVVLGAGVVLLAFAIARRVYPGWPALALATAAFVAFLPQHLATVSQVGNDVLAELLFALVLYQLVGWLRAPSVIPREYAGADRALPVGQPQSPIKNGRSAVLLGFLLGLILITKTTAYIALPLALGALIWRWLHDRSPAQRILADLALVAIPAAVIALPWFARNIATYGWPDFLALRRHDAVVVGQLRLQEYLAQFGPASYLQRLVEFTFKSFWGVFGWQGVFMDSRIYLALAILCGIAAGGLVLRVAWPVFRRPGARNVQHNSQSLWLLGATVLLTVLVYAWYNSQFVQHQGRYLFTALIPIAMGFAAGWDEALQPRSSLVILVGLVLTGVILAFWGIIAGPGLPKWPLALILVFALSMAAVHFIGKPNSRVRVFLFALPYAFLPLLSLSALFGAIVPQLAT